MVASGPVGWEKGMKFDDPMKYAAIAGLAAYVTGVVTVAAYAEHLDAASPDLMLFKAQYILTGAVSLLMLLFPALLVYATLHFVRERLWHLDKLNSLPVPAQEALLEGLPIDPPVDLHRLSRHLNESATKKRLFRFLLLGGTFAGTVLLCLAFYTVTLDAMVGVFPQVHLRKDLLRVALYATIAGVLAFCVWFIRRRDGSVSREAATAFLVTATAALCVSFCAIYADRVYPLIPEQFGGGKPKQAVLAFTAEGKQEAMNLGIPMVGDLSTSRPVKLLYQDDSFYTLRIESKVGIDQAEERNKEKPPVQGSIVQVTKGSVAGVKSDSRAPTADEVRIAAGDDESFDEKHDKLVMTFSEGMSTESIIPGWTGDERPVLLRIETFEPDPIDGRSHYNLLVYSRKENPAEASPVNVAGDTAGVGQVIGDDVETELVAVGRFELASPADLLVSTPPGDDEEERLFEATINRRELNIVVALKETIRTGPAGAADMDVTWTTPVRAKDLLGNNLEPDKIEDVDTGSS